MSYLILQYIDSILVMVHIVTQNTSADNLYRAQCYVSTECSNHDLTCPSWLYIQRKSVLISATAPLSGGAGRTKYVNFRVSVWHIESQKETLDVNFNLAFGELYYKFIKCSIMNR